MDQISIFISSQLSAFILAINIRILEYLYQCSILQQTNQQFDTIKRKAIWCYNYCGTRYYRRCYTSVRWALISSIWDILRNRSYRKYCNKSTTIAASTTTAATTRIAECSRTTNSPQFFASIGLVIGGIVLAVGIAYLVVSYGLLKGKGWAWTVTIIVSIIAIIVQIISAITTANAVSHMILMLHRLELFLISQAWQSMQ